MAILVYRNILGRRELLGKIEHGPGVDARFTYDKEFLVRTQGAGDLGISMRLPLDHTPYTAEEFNPFFQGMLPEGEVYSNLAKMYQVPLNVKALFPYKYNRPLHILLKYAQVP